MRAAIAEAFPRWARDPTDLCGGDRLGLANAPSAPAATSRRPPNGAGAARQRRVKSLAAEYALNWLLECFTKPTVSLIDGVVIGSGVGISLYGTHRVAGERYRFAMPETGIGLFPDDGVSWAFARMPDEIGMYLALTGRADRPGRCLPAGAGDALHPGRALRRDRGRARRRRPGRSAAGRPPRGPRPRRAGGPERRHRALLCRRHRRGHRRRLRAEQGGLQPGREGVLDDLSRRSPTSLKITHRHVRLARRARSARHARAGLPARLAGAWMAMTSTRACAPS